MNFCRKLLKQGIKSSLSYPVETVIFLLLVSVASYLILVLTSTSRTLPKLAYSNGSLYTTSPSLTKEEHSVLLKQVIISLPKPLAELSTHGILSPPLIDSFAALEDEIYALALEGEHLSPVTYEDLCWRQGSSCTIFSPMKEIFSKFPSVDPLEAVGLAIGSDNPKMISYAFQGLQHEGSSVQRADSLVLTLFLNYTTASQRQFAHAWEKRLSAIRLSNFYSQDLSIYFETVKPDGSVRYDLMDSLNQLGELLQTTHQTDLILIGVTFLFMQATLINLVLNMRLLGSKFFLAFAVLISSAFAFLVALFVLRVVGISLSTFHLMESIPFIVVCIGFEKPFLLTKTVLKSVENSKEPLRDKIEEGVSKVSSSILFEYFIECSVLFVCGFLGGTATVGRVCTMAGFIVAIDAVFLFTFYLAVLTLKLELRRMYIDDASKTVADTGIYDQKIHQTTFKEQKKLSGKIMSRAKLIAILTFLIGHIVTASGHFDSSEYSQNTALGSSIALGSPLSSLLEVEVSETLLIQVGSPFILHPTWIPQKIRGTNLPYSHSFINPETVLIFCVFIAVSALVGVVVIDNRTLAKDESKKAAAAVENPVNPVISKVPEVELPRADSGTALNDDASILLEKLKNEGSAALCDEEIIFLADEGKIASYALEKIIGNYTRAVKIRRSLVSREGKSALNDGKLPFDHYDYTQVFGVCCENVVGYIPIPVGIAGPMLIDSETFQIPMATTEGCLVASTSRGCKAISLGGGAKTELINDGMSRGPVVQFQSVREAAKLKRWIDGEGFAIIKSSFESTSRFAKLNSIKVGLAGKTAFLRFVTRTGDAMGMNMISKGVEKSLDDLGKRYPSMQIISISGNYCTDKKPAAINWIEGRGKSIVSEAVIPGKVVETVLKTSVRALVELNISKNLVGSAMAGSVGGFNAHAANIVTAVFLATGQDPAQNVESSNCMTLMEAFNEGKDLYISCSMPCIEVGTVGGGTGLGPQSACLDFLGIKGPNATTPGANAQQLARIVCAAVMAGELSLCSALAAGHLVKSHMAHNRSVKPAAGSCT